MMAAIVFWAAFTGIAYVYAGYPLLLMLWRRLARRTVHKEYQEPSVSLVMAMHNERKNVQAKIQNCFELDYPPDKLQLIVSLDAPTDGTDGHAPRVCRQRRGYCLLSGTEGQSGSPEQRSRDREGRDRDVRGCQATIGDIRLSAS